MNSEDSLIDLYPDIVMVCRQMVVRFLRGTHLCQLKK